LGDLSTERLLIRSFISTDLRDIHRILNAAFGKGEPEHLGAGLDERRSWMEWNALNARWLPAMFQPPYGDRAVVLRSTGELVGAAGYVPLLMPFDQIRHLVRTPGPGDSGQVTPEVGLFWAIDPVHQRRGYASEAGRALVDFAFSQMGLWRILATTEYDNQASQAVMRKLGMTITRNPHAEPAFMQVVGVKYAAPPDVSELRQEGLLT
jgi:RimJ/RimL family protein N-acetyltransferase